MSSAQVLQSKMCRALMKTNLLGVLFMNPCGAFLPWRHSSRWRDAIARHAEVICVGDALLDCITDDRESDSIVYETCNNGAWQTWSGGAPANVAAALCKLGTTSALVGFVGEDEGGHHVKNILSGAGVDISLLRQTNGTLTRRTMNTHQIYENKEANVVWGETKMEDGTEYFHGTSSIIYGDADTQSALKKVLADNKWIYCSTSLLAHQHSRDAYYSVVERALANGACLCVDVEYSPIIWSGVSESVARSEILRLANRAHIVKLTDEEAGFLLRVPAAEAFCDAERVHAEFDNAVAVLIRAGEKGTAYSMLGQHGIVPSFEVNISDTEGAGNSFTAGILHGLIAMDLSFEMFNVLVPFEQRPLIIAMLVRFATAVSALTYKAEGPISGQPTYSEVEAFLSQSICPEYHAP